MRISPVSSRLPVAGIVQTAPVARAIGAKPDDGDVDGSGERPARRGRRRPPRIAAPEGAASRSSAGVLSALIDLQVERY